MRYQPMMYAWSDTTSYSQSEKGERTPRAWTFTTPLLRVGVHRHIHQPGVWFVSCHQIDIDRRELISKDVDEARAEALAAVRARLADMLASLGPK